MVWFLPGVPFDLKTLCLFEMLPGTQKARVLTSGHVNQQPVVNYFTCAKDRSLPHISFRAVQYVVFYVQVMYTCNQTGTGTSELLFSDGVYQLCYIRQILMMIKLTAGKITTTNYEL